MVPILTEKLHQLTNSGNYRLCIEFLEKATSQWFSMVYMHVVIDDEANWYTLHSLSLVNKLHLFHHIYLYHIRPVTLRTNDLSDQ